MKQMFQEIEKRLSGGEELVFVTIIASSGSTPRGTGSRMVVTADGKMSGTIGGGAVEYKAYQMALTVLEEKKSYTRGFRLVRGETAELGMICGGDVIVYFQYISPENENFKTVCRAALESFDRDEDSWLFMDITDETAWSMGYYSRSTGVIGMEPHWESGDGLWKVNALQLQIGDRKYYSEPLVRAGKVYVFGGGHVAQEMVPVLAHLGFSCVIFDDREEFANKEKFPDAEETILGDFYRISDFVTITENDYICIMTRGHQYDYLVQKQSLATRAYYIGVMGSRKKSKTISEKLKEDGFSETDIERFTTPIGLAIGAETPAEIAISVAGQLIERRALKEGRKV